MGGNFHRKHWGQPHAGWVPGHRGTCRVHYHLVSRPTRRPQEDAPHGRTSLQPCSALSLEDVPSNLQPLSQAHQGWLQPPLYGSFWHHPLALSPEPDLLQLTLGLCLRPYTVLNSHCSSSVSRILTPQHLGSLSHSSWLSSLTEKAQVPEASREVSHLYQDPPASALGHKQS